MKKLFILLNFVLAFLCTSLICTGVYSAQLSSSTIKGNISITSILPSGYVAVEYIQNNGNQWINTEILANENNSFEVKAQLVNIDTTSQSIWGGRETATTNTYQGNQLSCRSSSTYQCINGNAYQLTSKAWDYNLHIFRSNKNIFYIDDELLYTLDNTSTITAENEVYLFATNTAGTAGFAGGSMKMYYCKIWNNQTLVRNFIPCLNNNNEAGFYDLVSKEFFGNANTQSTEPFLSGLPLKYEELMYIESTGHSVDPSTGTTTNYWDGQYINTGIKATNNTRVFVDYQLTNTYASFIFGSRTAGGSNTFTFNISNSNLVSAYGGYNIDLVKNGVATLADLERHTYDNNKGQITFDNVACNKLTTATTINCGSNLNLFASAHGDANNNGYLAGCLKLYSCEIYDNDIIVRKYIPCKNANGDVGLFDMVTATFFGNNGTGSFIAGEIS